MSSTQVLVQAAPQWLRSLCPKLKRMMASPQVAYTQLKR